MPLLALLDPLTTLFVAGWLTLAVELVTVFLRFGLGLKSGKPGSRLGRLTLGLRIHHGYVGAALLVASTPFGPASAAGTVLFFAGIALALSDIVHHFLVLWPLTGAPEFHLRYPVPVLAAADGVASGA
ncbi:MAG: hypothetical protein ACYTKD_28680 [Planctomycetota bacterium]|jgi:hypothetical protein